MSVITGEARGAGRATERTLLDFNTLTATFPDALPAGPAVRARSLCTARARCGAVMRASLHAASELIDPPASTRLLLEVRPAACKVVRISCMPWCDKKAGIKDEQGPHTCMP